MMKEYPEVPSPCFVLEENRLRKNLELIRSVAREAGVEVILAFKGFAMWSVFPIVREYISGATASSLHEAMLCAEEMETPAHTYAPVFEMETFPEIIRLSSHITFNSLSQYERFYPLIRESGKTVSVALRINPEFSEVETDLYNPCAPGSRLGIIAGHLGATLPEGIDGLHFHTLCESSSTDLEKTLSAVEEKFGHLLRQAKWINMGGGHLMTRKGYDTRHLITLLQNFKSRYPKLHVILEPGSAFAWESGFLKATVLDVVENKGIKTAMLNVSFAAHMPDCLEMPYQPRIRHASAVPLPGKPTYRMGGNSCLSGDYYGSWSFDEALHAGDDLILEDMVHYTMVKTTFFNGVQHPSIGIIRSNDAFELIRRFGYEDYKNKLS
ncbi:MAG: carboxynorspermidine decarboxylase [Mangrovibacterium sp.]|nr:carboxynorspermidine decarboxylase [Mangrovibacterium sp.]